MGSAVRLSCGVRAEKDTQAGGAADSGAETAKLWQTNHQRIATQKLHFSKPWKRPKPSRTPIARFSRMLLKIALVQSKLGRKSEARKLRQEALQIAKNLQMAPPKPLR